MAGHSDVIAAVAFSPDSNWLATASYDRTVKLWPIEGGEPKTLTGHTNWVFAVEFSADGSRLATSGYDKTVRIWDAATGKQLNQFTGHTATVRSVAIARDGQKLVSGSADRTARIWDLAGSNAPIELKGHEAAIRAVAFAPDGATVATAGEDNSVRIWDTATGKHLRTLSGHTNMVWCLSFSPGGRTLASGGFDNNVRIWDPQTGKSLQELKGHTDVVAALVYTADARALLTASHDKTLKRWAAKSPPVPPLADLQVADEGGARFGFITPDSKTLVTGSNTGFVKFWDLATGEMLKAVKQQRGMAGGEMSRDGTRLITSGYGSQVYLWDVVEQRQLAAIDIGHPDSVAVAISPDNSKLAAGGNDGAVVILEVASQSKLHELPGDGLPLGGVEFSPDGTLLATATGNYKEWQKPGTVKLWEVASGRELASLPGPKSKMRRVRFTADGQTLLACGAQHELLVYDVASRTLKHTIPTNDEISDIAVLPDRRTLVLGQYTGIVSLYDLQTKKRVGELDGHRQSANGKYVFSVSVSPDGSVVTSAAADSHVKLWSTLQGSEILQPLREIRDDETETYGLAWSPDGKLIATGSNDPTIELRDPKTLQVVRSLTGHAGRVFRLAFAPDGQWLASGGEDGTVRLWNPADGQELCHWNAYAQPMRAVRALAVSPDGRLLAAGNRGGEILLWDAVERKVLRNLPKQSLTVSGIAFSPDGSLMATSTGIREQWRNPGDVRLWSTSTGEELARFDGATGEMRCVSFNEAGTRLMALGLVTADNGRTAFCKIFVWDVAQRKLLSAHAAETGLTAGVVLPGDKQVIVANGKGELSIRDLSDGRVLAAATAHDKQISQIALSPDGAVFATTGLDGMLKLWPAASQPGNLLVPVAEVRDDETESFTVAWSPDGALLATGSKDKTLELRDAKTLEVVRSIASFKAMVFRLAFHPDGKWLASASNGVVRLWNPADGQELVQLKAYSDVVADVRSLAVSADGSQIAAGNWEGEIFLWDATSFKLIRNLAKQSLPVTGLAFSPDGALLATCTGSWKEYQRAGEVRLWTIATGEELASFSGPAAELRGICFDRAGKRLIAYGKDKQAFVWDVKQRTQISSFASEIMMSAAALLPDDRRLAIGDLKGGVTVRELETGRIVASAPGGGKLVSQMAISPDGTTLATAALDGMVRLFRLTSEQPKPPVSLADTIRSWPARQAGNTIAKGDDKQ
jgi:WD40 repeat protein